MAEALKNSRYMYIWGEGWRRQGWFGAMILISRISNMVMMPRVYIRAGDVDPDDIKHFPPHLKRLLKVKSVLLVGAGVWLVILYMLVKFK